MTNRGYLQKHRNLASRLDDWFRALQAKHADQILCGHGCAGCCVGLFDVSLPDAFRVAEAFSALGEEIRSEITARALRLQEKISREGPELREPFLLSGISQDRIDRLVEQIQDARCPLLGQDEECLIYADRPLACRLEGIPMVDAQDGLFGDWCALNFVEGVFPDTAEDLRLDYYEIQAVGQEVTERLSYRMIGQRLAEATVFLPSVIASFDSFWKFQIKRNSPLRASGL